MDTLKRLSVVTNNFEELKEKVLELTKNDFSWALECNIKDEDKHIIDTKLLILSDFKYDIEDEDYNPKDKWSFAASVGHYRNANAVAVGAAY